MDDFEEKSEKSNSLTVKLVEVYNGQIHHILIDGLYLNSGDLIALFESDRDEYLEFGMEAAAEFTDRLIDRIRLMVLRRNNYE
jgi:hypothetical protein